MTRGPHLALGVAAGLALAGAHPPFGMGLLALAVPALLVAGTDVARRGAGRPWAVGSVAAAVGHGLMLGWVMIPAGLVGWALLVLVHVGWWALLAWTVTWLPPTPARPLLVGLLWIGIDALRAIVPLNGFAWGTLGAATVDLPWLATLARLAGEKAMTLAVVVLSVAAWEALRGPLDATRGADGRVVWARVRGALPAGRVGAAWLAGTAMLVTLATIEPPPPVGQADVLMVQPSGPDVVEGTGVELDTSIARSAVDLTSESVRRSGVPDLTVWPESTIDTDPARVPGLAEALARGGELTDGALLAGANLDGPRPGTFRNTVLSVGADGAWETAYQKRRLVPFGEYVPFREALDWFPPLQQVPRDALPGGAPDAITVDGLRVATVICFETLFGSLVGENVLAGPEPAHLLVTLTNDASFGRRGEARQHLAQSQLRALETGRWVAHAAISGASAFVDPDGNLHQRTELFEATSVRRSVDLVRGRTPFLATGDWLQPVALAALALLVIGAVRRRQKAYRAAAMPSEDAP